MAKSNGMAIKARLKKPLFEYALEEIQRKIITLEFEPGQPLDEKRISTLLGIGRTPIREALLKLSSSLMVQLTPNRGFVVKPITLQGTKSALDALKSLEFTVCEMIVKYDNSSLIEQMRTAQNSFVESFENRSTLQMVNANYNFHMIFDQGSRNEFLVHALQQVRLETMRLDYLNFGPKIDIDKGNNLFFANFIEDHERFIKELEDENEEGLKSTITNHIERYYKRIMSYLMK